MNVNEPEYRSAKFIVALDCEKQTNAGFSGLNTRAGDLITIRTNNLQRTNNAGEVYTKSIPDYLHCTLEYDAIMTITDAGVTVLE